MVQETQIFSPISTYCFYLDADEILIDAYEHYQKRSFRNRFTILTSQGPTTLSIPLKKGKNQQMIISDVSIAYEENWTDVHCKTLIAAYKKSPYFDYYFDEIADVYNKKITSLLSFNTAMLQVILKSIKMEIPIRFSESYISEKKLPSHINDIWQPYTQVWSEKFDFVPNLSIIDALFCLGPDLKSYLKQQNTINKR